MRGKTIETPGEIVWLDEAGILHTHIKPNIKIELHHAKLGVEAMQNVSGGKIRPVLVDVRHSRGTTPEARAYYAGEGGATVTKACAMLIGSPLSRMIGNFFLGFNKPRFPFRLFNDEQKAIYWLKQFLED